MVKGIFMSWTPVTGGFARTLNLPRAPENLPECFGVITITSTVNGDAVSYDTNGPNLEFTGPQTINVLLPTVVVNRILNEGQARIQLDVTEPDGSRHTLLGGLFKVNAEGNDLVPVVPPHPNADVKAALNAASTQAAIKAAVIAYFDRLDP